MLVIPDVDEFSLFKGEDFDEDEIERVELFLKMATVLVFLRLKTLGVAGRPDLNDPETDNGLLVRWAVLDLAWYLGTSMEDRDAMFSPFSSERIGSYSYSKAQQAARVGGRLGVPFFDMLLDFLDMDLETAAAGASWASSSKVFSTDTERFLADLHPTAHLLFSPLVRREDPSP